MLPSEPYLEQVARWPRAGRHILAHADEATVVVYQAYSPEIAGYALEHGEFGGPHFSFSRMSWIKPNFLWMMYRSSWATAEGQQVVLGIRISRGFFEQLLAAAVHSSWRPDSGEAQASWQAKLAASEVRLQWDPDHDPVGGRQERRAVQLGLRGSTLRAFGTSEIRELIDMTPFVAEQRAHTRRESWSQLRTPLESVYTPRDPAAVANVGLEP
jgi:hypothetical protein